MRWARLVALVAVAALVAIVAGESSAHSGHRAVHSSTGHQAIPPNITKIRHVVIIMQENRSFDHYFGSYARADGIPGLAGHPGRIPCIPDPEHHKCVHPYHDRRNLDYGGPHNVQASVADVNGGKMNGFIAEHERGLKGCKCHIPPGSVVGYHNGRDIPNYWAYARNYVLQDHMFESARSRSLVSHLYLVSLWSAHCTKHNDPASCRNALESPGNPPNAIYAWTDLTYLLYKHHISWRYYVFKGIEPDCESDTSLKCAPAAQGPRTPSFWNPLPAFDTVRDDHQEGNIQSLNGFFAAVYRNRLPAVSWIVPNGVVSDHPETSRVSRAQTYVTGLINTVMQSPAWKSTAIFLVWDDWGGMYDHMRPAHVDQNGYGIRVPGLLISPYARRGYVDHQTLSFDAYAKFIEEDFLGGQRLDPHTDGRPDPRPDVREDAPNLGALIKEFNFSQPPRKPVLLPVHPKTDLINR
jgi:phospholipase C